ncbi:unnamed protein product [Prorocentrum cordatum]|uniref:Uncharacterized protein n=1 Tax=Prorocentrum cordatum TaxID=2364126 RepID=A0ABN9SFV7_9DINO|nr:unnamed protein product [Polarella glacialis]
MLTSSCSAPPLVALVGRASLAPQLRPVGAEGRLEEKRREALARFGAHRRITLEPSAALRSSGAAPAPPEAAEGADAAKDAAVARCREAALAAFRKSGRISSKKLSGTFEEQEIHLSFLPMLSSRSSLSRASSGEINADPRSVLLMQSVFRLDRGLGGLLPLLLASRSSLSGASSGNVAGVSSSSPPYFFFNRGHRPRCQGQH